MVAVGPARWAILILELEDTRFAFSFVLAAAIFMGQNPPPQLHNFLLGKILFFTFDFRRGLCSTVLSRE